MSFWDDQRTELCAMKGHCSRGALDILHARGEIDREEFLARKRDL
jgi:hypothetical protein